MRSVRWFPTALVQSGMLAAVLAAVSLFISCGHDRPPQGIDTLWTRSIGGLYSEEAQDVLLTSGGEIIITGTTSTFGAGGFDIYLLRLSASGDLVWDTTYGGDRDEQAYACAAMPDGGLAICGLTNSFGAGAEDVYLLRTTVLGDTVWTRTYGGTAGDAGYDLAVTADTGLVVAGIKGSDIYLIRTTSSGDTVWTRTYGGAGNDFATALVPTSDNGYVITGATSSFGAGSGDVYLFKVDESGNLLWSRTFGGTRNDWGTAVVETADQGFLITGYTESFGNGGYDVYVIRTNDQGDSLWTRTYGEDGDECGYDVCANLDGSFVICGGTTSYGDAGFDALLLKIDADGEEVWKAVYGGSEDDITYALAITPDNSYLAVGYSRSWGVGGADVFVLKTVPDP